MLGTFSCCQCCLTKLGNIIFHTDINMLFDYLCNSNLYRYETENRGAAALKASLQHVRAVQNGMTAMLVKHKGKPYCIFHFWDKSERDPLAFIHSNAYVCEASLSCQKTSDSLITDRNKTYVFFLIDVLSNTCFNHSAF